GEVYDAFDVGADGFQRHVVAERGVEGVVDLAHAALGEEALDAVAAGHQLAGEEGGAEPLRLLATAGNGVSRSGGRGRWLRRTRDGSLRRRRRGGELVLDALGDLRRAVVERGRHLLAGERVVERLDRRALAFVLAPHQERLAARRAAHLETVGQLAPGLQAQARAARRAANDQTLAHRRMVLAEILLSPQLPYVSRSASDA